MALSDLAPAVPGDTDNAKDGAKRIREEKLSVLERLKLEHYWDSDTDPLVAAADGRHIPGGASVLGVDTYANMIASTNVGTMTGQIKMCSDNSSIWYWDHTNTLWIRATPQVIGYISTLPGNTQADVSAGADIKMDGDNTSVTLAVVNGDAVFIDVCMLFHSYTVTTTHGDVRLKVMRDGTEYVPGSDATYSQRIYVQDDSTNDDMNLVGRWLDSAPTTNVTYTNVVYTLVGSKGAGIDKWRPTTTIIKFTIFRTAVVA